MATRDPLTRWLALLSMAAAILLVLTTGSARAATIKVDGRACTLANAILSANGDSAVGGCTTGNGADTLNLTAPLYTLTKANNNTKGPNGLPLVTSVIALNGDPDGDGNGAIIQSSSAAGTPAFRLLYVANSHLTLKHITVRNGNVGILSGGGLYNDFGAVTLTNSTVSGNSAGQGGGLHNESGIVTLSNSTVSGNSAGQGGGGLDTSYGTVTLTSSTVSGNTAGAFGGGLLNSHGTVTLTNCTVSGNGAGQSGGGGGGLFNSHGTVTLTNSTVSGNSAVQVGGGLFNAGTMTLTHSTVSGNSADFFDGGLANSGTVTLTNSLIANSSSGDCGDGSVVQFKGVNLIEDGSCNVAAHGGFTGDPKLGLLLDNGGSTLTYALLAGSPAINRANNTMCPPADQRGTQRPQGTVCDIGAFERILTAAPKVKPIVRFFDQAAAQGDLAGTGKTSRLKSSRLAAVRNQVLLTGDYTTAALPLKACRQLKATQTRIDPDNTADRDDYVTGTAAADLMRMIEDLVNDLGCS